MRLGIKTVRSLTRAVPKSYPTLTSSNNRALHRATRFKAPSCPPARPFTKAHSFGRTHTSFGVAAAMVQIEQLPALKDNYIYVVHDPDTDTTAVVDPSEAPQVDKLLKERGWKLTHILNTHHHWDHTGANLELKERYNCLIVGPRADAERIPGIDVKVGEGDTYELGKVEVQVMDTPGHTKGHISFYLPRAEALFCGDTLFCIGAGRAFEMPASVLWQSIRKYKALPPTTKVYCAHEYTQSNARFALSIDGSNLKLRERADAVNVMREKGQPTVPSALQEEFDTNPFMRPDSPQIRAHFGFGPDADDADVFTAIRKAKDNF